MRGSSLGDQLRSEQLLSQRPGPDHGSYSSSVLARDYQSHQANHITPHRRSSLHLVPLTSRAPSARCGTNRRRSSWPKASPCGMSSSSHSCKATGAQSPASCRNRGADKRGTGETAVAASFPGTEEAIDGSSCSFARCCTRTSWGSCAVRGRSAPPPTSAVASLTRLRSCVLWSGHGVDPLPGECAHSLKNQKKR